MLLGDDRSRRSVMVATISISICPSTPYLPGERAMKLKAIPVAVVFFMGLFGAALAAAQSSPPPSPKAQEVEAMVDKAAVLVDAKGKAAFSEFRTKGSGWFHGDTYLFA